MFYHFVVVIIMTVVVSVIVIRRYAAGVSEDMGSVGPVDLAVPPYPAPGPIAPLTIVQVDPTSRHSATAQATNLEETMTRRRIVAAYLISTGACGLVVSAATLWANDIEFSAPRLIALTGATMGAAIPMIAVSVAWPFWRALLTWVLLELAAASLTVVVPMIGRVLGQSYVDPMLAMNAFYMFQWTAVTLAIPFAFAFVTGIRKLRGVAPVSLALISVLGLVPLAGARGANVLAFGEEAAVQELSITLVMYVSFFVLAPATAWGAWRVLKALANAYDAKRFSDAQLLAWAWWLIFVATLNVNQPFDGSSFWGLLLAGVVSFALFPVVTAAVLGIGRRRRDGKQAPTLLLLRLFGHTARSERFFDRVVGRWRLTGPVTVIGAPDILARTFDPADFLQFVTGRTSQAFVESQPQLDRRLSELDLRPDPDGRYRVSEFWCRGNSWQATVTALMSRCDAIVADVRGLTAGREGVRFELEQLAARVPANRVVLVVDHQTDRGLIERSVAKAKGTLRLVHVERNSASETSKVFETLMDAAQTQPELLP